MKTPAIFLDRDGTINEDVGYICSMEEFRLVPNAIEAMRMLEDKYELFIVTNQSGVARGFFTEEELIDFNRQVEAFLLDKGIKIKKTYYCPHLSVKDCECHKPSPYFLKQAEKEYDVDLPGSFTIGDHPHDIEMGIAAGVKPVYLFSGHGRKHKDELTAKPVHFAEDLYEAAKWIINGE